MKVCIPVPITISASLPAGFKHQICISDINLIYIYLHGILLTYYEVTLSILCSSFSFQIFFQTLPTTFSFIPSQIVSPNPLPVALLLSHDCVLCSDQPIAHFNPLNFCLVSCSLLAFPFTSTNYALFSSINDDSICLPRCYYSL